MSVAGQKFEIKTGTTTMRIVDVLNEIAKNGETGHALADHIESMVSDQTLTKRINLSNVDGLKIMISNWVRVHAGDTDPSVIVIEARAIATWLNSL